MADIFDTIRARDETAAKVIPYRKVQAWVVSRGNGRWNSGLCTYAYAVKLANRYNRIYKTDLAYFVRFGKVTLWGPERLLGE